MGSRSVLWTDCVSPKSKMLKEAPVPSKTVFGGRAFRGNLGYMRSQGWFPHDGMSVLTKREDRRPCSLPCEGTTRGQPSANQEEGSHQNPAGLAP